MTLLDYIEQCPEGEEITVLDNTYDLEVYFYNQVQDEWDEAMMKLASKLNVLEARQDSVVVDLYELIDANIENLENSGLFYDADTDALHSSNTVYNQDKKDFKEFLDSYEEYLWGIEHDEGHGLDWYFREWEIPKTLK
jgi:hypothetical protein